MAYIIDITDLETMEEIKRKNCNQDKSDDKEKLDIETLESKNLELEIVKNQVTTLYLLFHDYLTESDCYD